MTSNPDESTITILKPVLDTGLNIRLLPGRVRFGITVYELAEETVLMVDAQTNYVFVDSADGLIKSNTSGFIAGCIPIAEVVTAGGSVSTIADKRAFLVG